MDIYNLLLNYKPKNMVEWHISRYDEDTSNKENKAISLPKKRDRKSKKTKSIIKNYTSLKREWIS